jgi:hypothetical protein
MATHLPLRREVVQVLIPEVLRRAAEQRRELGLLLVALGEQTLDLADAVSVLAAASCCLLRRTFSRVSV